MYTVQYNWSQPIFHSVPYLELTKVGSTPQPVNKILHIFQDEISEGEEQAGQPGLPAQEEGATRGKQAQAARTRGGTQ